MGKLPLGIAKYPKVSGESIYLTDIQLIEVMWMLTAAINGVIAVEQSGVMTLARSSDQSYAVILEVLMAAVQHIKQQKFSGP